MKKCGKSRCQICSYVEEVEEFEYISNKKYCINYPFDCNSEVVIYEIGLVVLKLLPLTIEILHIVSLFHLYKTIHRYFLQLASFFHL